MRARTPLILMAVLALVAPAASGRPSAAAGTQPAPAPAASHWPHQNLLEDAAAAVEDAGRARFPEVYAGVSLDLPGGALVAYRIPGSESFDRAVRDLVSPSLGVRYVDVAYSQRQLNAWAAEITADAGYWSAQGVTLHLVGVIKIGRCVTVGIEDPARYAAVITARYPGRAICVEYDAGSDPLTTPGDGER